MSRAAKAGRLVAALLLLGIHSPSHAEWRYLETLNLRVIYSAPYLDNIAPYAARSLESSLAGQKARFDYVPGEKVTAWLLDRADYGGASAAVLPWNRVTFDVAPKNTAFETFSSGERIRTWSNHELVHVTMMDQAAPEDEFWRHVFLGKVVPVSEHPETIFYSYLTNPRFASPSWYLEGAAVFMETWMAGGLGRAQGAYDEMVFRSMVLDDSHFYDPLGLVAEGTEIDFRAGSNAYLYGTRFMSYLAYQYSPDSLIRWWKRGPGTLRSYSDQFQQVFGLPLGAGMAGLDPLGAPVPAGQPGGDPEVPDDAIPRRLRPRARVGFPRNPGPRDEQALRRCSLPGRGRPHRLDLAGRRVVGAAAGDQPAHPLPGDVAGL